MPMSNVAKHSLETCKKNCSIYIYFLYKLFSQYITLVRALSDFDGVFFGTKYN
jgi:hypothetical protein